MEKLLLCVWWFGETVVVKEIGSIKKKSKAKRSYSNRVPAENKRESGVKKENIARGESPDRTELLDRRGGKENTAIMREDENRK